MKNIQDIEITDTTNSSGQNLDIIKTIFDGEQTAPQRRAAPPQRRSIPPPQRQQPQRQAPPQVQQQQPQPQQQQQQGNYPPQQQPQRQQQQQQGNYPPQQQQQMQQQQMQQQQMQHQQQMQQQQMQNQQQMQQQRPLKLEPVTKPEVVEKFEAADEEKTEECLPVHKPPMSFSLLAAVFIFISLMSSGKITSLLPTQKPIVVYAGLSFVLMIILMIMSKILY